MGQAKADMAGYM